MFILIIHIKLLSIFIMDNRIKQYVIQRSDLFLSVIYVTLQPQAHSRAGKAVQLRDGVRGPLSICVQL